VRGARVVVQGFGNAARVAAKMCPYLRSTEVAERRRCAVGNTPATGRAENEEFTGIQLGGIPAYAGILHVAGGRYTSTGIEALRITLSATLPNNMRWTPPRPCVANAITSSGCAIRRMASSTLCATTVSPTLGTLSSAAIYGAMASAIIQQASAHPTADFKSESPRTAS
jgi:hypothetical protein